ncbi:MAG TPA: EamA family transporter [Candidatus Dormibacteraeota bacterium]|nr:EamA family transporter [Candidatus Dormibacteraeota bacterium]
MATSTSSTDQSPPISSGGSLAARTPHRATPLLIAAFAVVYVIWGSTYLAIRVGIESFPPLLLAGSRHLLVGVILFPLLLWKTGERPTFAQWRTTIVTGLLLLFIGNGGVCLAEKTVPSGVAALLVATVSLWMVLIDWLRPGGSRPLPRVIGGILMGFAGLTLLVGPAKLGGSGRIDPFGAEILVLASLSWACGSLYSKHGVLPKSALLGVSMQSLSGGAALWIAGLVSREVRAFHLETISLRSWIAFVYLVVFGSALGFTAYIYILKQSTAARVATYAFVNPVVALFLGWLMAGETITLRTVSAAAVILTAVLVVITAPHPDPISADHTLPVPGEA